jgi:hypothetical protein
MTEQEVNERKELHEELREQYQFDMDNPPKIDHHWVDRGLVMSCENAGHRNHRHFKVRLKK